jgi:hypothetical protein
MQLDEQFPNAAPGFRTPSGFYKSRGQLECFHCGKPSAWFHLGNLLFFCSEGCYHRYAAGEKHHARLNVG